MNLTQYIYIYIKAVSKLTAGRQCGVRQNVYCVNFNVKALKVSCAYDIKSVYVTHNLTV